MYRNHDNLEAQLQDFETAFDDFKLHPPLTAELELNALVGLYAHQEACVRLLSKGTPYDKSQVQRLVDISRATFMEWDKHSYHSNLFTNPAEFQWLAQINIINSVINETGYCAHVLLDSDLTTFRQRLIEKHQEMNYNNWQQPGAEVVIDKIIHFKQNQLDDPGSFHVVSVSG